MKALPFMVSILLTIFNLFKSKLMFSKNTSLLAIALFMTLVACKKDETAVIAPDNKTFLTSGKWKMVAETVAGVDAFAVHDACEHDNTFSYSTDGKLTFDEGTVMCDPNGEKVSLGSWAFISPDKKKLFVTQGIIGITAEIMEINGTTMKWRYTNPFDNAVTVQTFTK
jgi:hypothetical protein